MTTTDARLPATVAVGRRRGAVLAAPLDLQERCRLVLATIWLLDAVLQLQPIFFARGASGFSGMLKGLTPGNPSWVAHTLTWNASIVGHDPILTNAVFALVQFLIGFGIVWRRTYKPALALSIVWALGVWWFGEGAGGILRGGASPLGGGPGAVLFYALLAVLLWPHEGSDGPFVAARALGVRTAKKVWATTWLVLAVLSVVGSGRSPQALSGFVAILDHGQPGWLAGIDRTSESLLLHDGTVVAIALASLCVAIAASVYLSTNFTRIFLVLAILTFTAIWIAVENVGGILAGGATDPNSGPLVILLALAFWPLSEQPTTPRTSMSGEPLVARLARS
jgi:hypothetical protein